MTLGKPLIVAAVIAVSGVAGLAFWRTRTAPARPRTSEREAIHLSSSRPVGTSATTVVAAAGTIEQAGRVAVVAAALRTLQDETRARELSRSVADALGAYGSEDPGRYLAWMDAQGLAPPRGIDATEAGAARWLVVRRGVAGATLDFAASTVVYRVHNGQPVPPASNASRSGVGSRASRADRGVGDVDPIAAHSDSVDVEVPGQFPTPDGSVAAGRLLLTFARRPADGKWVIVGTGFQVSTKDGQTYFPPPV